MALFTSAMPSASGDDERDIAALRAWACKLVSELRSLLYALDEQNVLRAGEALKVNASGVAGMLGEEQIPDIDISKVKGNRPYCIVEPGTANDTTTGFSIMSGDTPLARIFYDTTTNALVVCKSEDNGSLSLRMGTKDYFVINDEGITTNLKMNVNNTIEAKGIDTGFLTIDGNAVTVAE